MKPRRVGYLSVIVPSVNFWQGYFINDVFADEARKTIAKMRKHKVLRRGSVVLEDLDIAAADQPLVGNLCSTIVEAALGRIEHPQASIGVCGYALRKLVDCDYFWIEGDAKAGGTRTRIRLIDVLSTDAARIVIDNLPSVQLIKQRLLAGMINPRSRG